MTGHAYLAGPYKGAPLSLEIITPAIAGPFDLGVVVVRTALRVDPLTTADHRRLRPDPDDPPRPAARRPLDLDRHEPAGLHPQPDQLRTEVDHRVGDLDARRDGAPLSQYFQARSCAALASSRR